MCWIPIVWKKLLNLWYSPPQSVWTDLLFGKTSVTAKIRDVLMLGKISRVQKRWCGQQRWICSHGWNGSLIQTLISKKMAMKVSVWQRFCLGHETSYQVFKLTTKATKYIEVEVFKRKGSTSSSQFIK